MFYPWCPLEVLVNIKEFYDNSNFNDIDETDNVFKTSFRNWCAKIREWNNFRF